MTNTINTNNQLRNGTVSSGKASGSENTSGKQPSATPAAEESDQLSLQSTSLAQQLSDKVKAVPEINQARVDAIKDALSRGEYKPDADQIAKKFIEIESLLP